MNEPVDFFVFVHGNHGHSEDWYKFEKEVETAFAKRYGCISMPLTCRKLWVLKSIWNQADTSIGNPCISPVTRQES
jgi:hypothetical protein